MTQDKRLPALTFVATGIIASGLALTTLPAQAAVTHPPALTATHPATHAATSTHPTGPAGRGPAKPLSKARLAALRERQRQMAAQHHTAPSFARAASKTFTVDTTEDSDLATPTATTCVDAASGKCSLRAAVDAANNLRQPVTIALGSHVYTLSLATALTVTNAKGTSVVGHGPSKTSIRGDGSGIFSVDALSNAASGLLFVTGADVNGGTAFYGAGFYLNDGNAGATLVLDHVVVSANATGPNGFGAGVYASDYSSIYATDTTFTNNSASYGGALYTYTADVNFTNVDITGNHSAGSNGAGSAIYNVSGVLRIKGGNISGNTAGDASNVGTGGALYDLYGNITLSGVRIDSNTASFSGQGGALYLYYDLVEINGGTMSHNRASGANSEGGAIYQTYGSQVDLHGVAMDGNRVDRPSGALVGGGAIYLTGINGYGNQTTIDRGTRITGSNAGAIYSYAHLGQIDLTIADSTLSGNYNGADNGYSGYGCGGAICAYNDDHGATNLTMTGSKVLHNSSTGNNGSGAVTVYATGNNGASVLLRGNRFEQNVAGPGGSGGAILFYNSDAYSPTSVRSQSNIFAGNRAGSSTNGGSGGAIALYFNAVLTDRGSTFSDNAALGAAASGGAIYDVSFQSSRFTGTTFKGNRAGPTSTGSGDGYGGAVYSSDTDGTAFSQVTMSGNRAASYGGGLYTDNSSYGVSLERSTVSGNTAGSPNHTGFGGGMYTAAGSLVLENSTVAGNLATSTSGSPGQGGGIWHTGSTLGLRSSTVSRNVAQQGGGIYAAAYGGNLLNSIVSLNHAARGGAEQDCAAIANYARLHSLGGNLLGQGGCVTSRRSSDKLSRKPRLGRLKDNGGPTRTMAISAKSPAIGRATFQIPDTDQRGRTRPAHHADAGAFELPKVKKHHHHHHHHH
jgi:CSLREA domain-containing protein